MYQYFTFGIKFTESVYEVAPAGLILILWKGPLSEADLNNWNPVSLEELSIQFKFIFEVEMAVAVKLEGVAGNKFTVGTVLFQNALSGMGVSVGIPAVTDLHINFMASPPSRSKKVIAMG